MHRERLGKALPVLLLALLLGAAPVAAATPAPMTLSMDDLVALGLERNPDLKAARAELEASTWAKRSSYLAFLPTGSLSSSVTRVDDETLAQSNQAAAGMNQLFTQLGVTGVELDPFLYRDTYRTSLTVNQEFPLNLHLLGGRNMAVAAEKAGRCNLAGGRDRLILDLRTAAFRLLAARELEQVAAESVAAAENRLLLARDREELGQINRAERLRWDVALADARAQLVAARNGAVLAEMTVNRLLRQDLDTPLAVEPDPDCAARGRTLHDLGAEAVAEMTIADSPAARALRAVNEISAGGETLALSGLMPSLHFQFSYGWRENDTMALDDYESWSATALVNLPVFDLASGWTDYRKGAAEKRRSDYETAAALDGLRLSAHAAWREVGLAEETLKHRETAERQARESFDLMSDRRELGHITEFDLVDMQTALAAARARAVAARYDYYIALAALESLVGEDNPNLHRQGE